MAAVRPSVAAQRRYHMYLPKASSHQHLDLQFLWYLALYKLCYADSSFGFDLLHSCLVLFSPKREDWLDIIFGYFSEESFCLSNWFFLMNEGSDMSSLKFICELQLKMS